MTHLIIPLATSSNYFPIEEYFFPKPLIDIDGLPMILKVMENFEMNLDFQKYTFIIPENLSTKYSIDSIIRLNTNKVTNFVFKKAETSGALCSSLLSVDKLSDNEDIVIANMDEIIDINLNEIITFFRENSANGGMIAFKSNHPRWVYLDCDKEGVISSCAEKKVISNLAGAGFYYFKNKEIYYESARNALLGGECLDNSYYLSSAMNQIILDRGDVFAYRINSSNYHTFYKPQSIQNYINKKRENGQGFPKNSKKTINIVIPAAGRGSRFQSKGWKKSKPLIDVAGKPMIIRVMENVSIPHSKFLLITQDKILDDIKNSLNGREELKYEILGISSITEGTACTVLKAYDQINNDDALLIANSDQLVNFDCAKIIDKCQNENLDGLILTFTDPERDPKWSFVRVDENQIAIEVAEKVAISDKATVGLYYFRRGSDFVKGAIEMILNLDKTNNEYYVCPVYNYLIRRGLKIGICDIREEDMHGLGTPEDLMSYLKDNLLPKSKDEP